MNQPSPSIISRDRHPISRRSLSPNAVKVLYRLRDNGFIACLVGGCVRDLLLGREPKDFDIVTDATPTQIKKLFRNCRLVGRRFRLAHLHFGEEIIEVATFRSASPETALNEPPEDGRDDADRDELHLRDDDGMLLRDNLFGTPEEDALRRDFTINALTYNIADFSIVDSVGGMDDLQHGLIRTIGFPLVRFTEDPVRMLRAVRFAALLGFEIEKDSWDAILQLAPTIQRAAPARLYEEILKLFLCGEAARTLQLLRQSGLFTALFPRFEEWMATESDGFPHTGIGRATAWVDDRRREGEPVSPPLLLTLMFGQYLAERSERLVAGGMPPQPAIHAATADFFGDLAATVRVPQRVCTAVAAILSCQGRFDRTPGKRPQSFVSRPAFADAFRYLRFAGSSDADRQRLVAWWEQHLAGVSPPEASVTPGPAPRKKRRRRGRRRPRSGTAA